MTTNIDGTGHLVSKSGNDARKPVYTLQYWHFRVVPGGADQPKTTFQPITRGDAGKDLPRRDFL